MVSRKKAEEGQALSLLLAHLNPEQRDTYEYEQWFQLKGNDGLIYRLYHCDALKEMGEPSTARLVSLDAKVPDDFYVYARNVWIQAGRYVTAPEEDTLLALKVMVEVCVHNISGCESYLDRQKMGILPIFKE